MLVADWPDSWTMPIDLSVGGSTGSPASLSPAALASSVSSGVPDQT
jgi:hypothetical protein